MNELIHIGNADISIKEYYGKRVVTFKDIDLVHGRPEGTARRNFATNKERFIDGEDYFILTPQTLEDAGMYEIRSSGISDVNPRGTAFITEQGYLMLVKSFTDDLAWDIQRQLVNGYFKTKTVTNSLSPELQILQGLLQQMIDKEVADKERDRQIAMANETASKAIETTENIKEAVRPITDNWREEINSKFNRIQRDSGIPFSLLRTEVYGILQNRAGCDLDSRLRNRKQRMASDGETKTNIGKLSKMDIIESDKKLREIFAMILTEYEIQYCA